LLFCDDCDERKGFLVPGCDGAPLLPLVFIIVNIGFNVALLHLLKISSAVVSSLASTFSGMQLFHQAWLH